MGVRVFGKKRDVHRLIADPHRMIAPSGEAHAEASAFPDLGSTEMPLIENVPIAAQGDQQDRATFDINPRTQVRVDVQE